MCIRLVAVDVAWRCWMGFDDWLGSSRKGFRYGTLMAIAHGKATCTHAALSNFKDVDVASAWDGSYHKE